MDEYLAFVDDIGENVDGEYVYRFYFTSDTDIVWGEYFNIVPSAIIPNLQVDKNSVSSSAKANFPNKLILAKKNYCFSMQDCIDGIIPLCFAEIGDDKLTIDDVPFFLRFGETHENVVKILGNLNIKLYDEEKIEIDSEKPIKKLINKLDEHNNDIDDLDF
jgi:hypothetical protein